MSDNLAQLNGNLAKLPPTQFVVCFYVNNTNSSQDEWMNPFAETLRRHGYFTVGITTPQSAAKCALAACNIQAELQMEEVAQIRGIHVFIVSDMDFATSYPSDSRVLGCPHAFELTKESNLLNQLQFLPTLDGWLVSCPLNGKSRQMITDLFKGYCEPGGCLRKSPYFYIIPGGYPRLAVLSAKVAASHCKPDSIVYAPIGLDHARKMIGINILEKSGVRIIRNLLAAFPDLNVIYRPYRPDLDSGPVLKIRDSFANEKRFIFDPSPGRLFSFSRGLALVTDVSHIGQSFAFTTLRPTIYFRPWEKAGMTEDIFSLVPNGYATTTFSGLIAVCKHALANMGKQKELLSAIRDRYLMSIDNAFDEIAGWLPDFYKGRPHADWLAIPRNDPELACPEMLLLSKNSSLTALAVAATYRKPPSPLLTALCLHKGQALAPDATLRPRFGEAVKSLLGEDCGQAQYGDVAAADVRHLYKLALAQYIKNGHPAEEIRMIESLAANYEEFTQGSIS